MTVPRALAFLGAQLGCGLGVLLALNPHSVALGASSLALVATYPLFKRFFAWPQLVLGLTFNWGALLGWSAARCGDASLGSVLSAGFAGGGGLGGAWDAGCAAVASGVAEHAALGSMAWPGVVLPLYGAGVCWTLVYDTLYAHQDKADDRRLGLRSSALTLGDRASKPALLGFGALAVGGLATAGAGAGAGWPFFAAVGATAAHLAWQVTTADLDDRLNLTRRFVSNQHVGLAVFLGAVAGNLV